jgi:ubiquinone/menaquinone biosynthesis C-methylase UbiE
MTESEKSEYTYPDVRTQEEAQRLRQAAELVNLSTRRLLEDAGLVPGMRVLDLGSGAGDVAFLAAELVGPCGSVVGVDMNSVSLETARERARLAGLTNVTFLEGDLGTIELEGKFDALVGRDILQHIPNPAVLLRRLLSYVQGQRITLVGRLVGEGDAGLVR